MKIFLSVLMICFAIKMAGQVEVPKTYSDAVKKIGLRLPADYYYKKNVNIYKYEELKNAGFDLREYEKRYTGTLSYIDAAVIADAAVIGTIISKEYDTNKDVAFHSKYKVRVESVVKGEKLKSTIITINLGSGMISDRLYTTISTEQELFIGEKVLLFLNYIPFEDFAERKKAGTLSEKINVDIKDKECNFLLQSKFTIRSNKLYDEFYTELGELEVALGVIKKINNINHIVNNN